MKAVTLLGGFAIFLMTALMHDETKGTRMLIWGLFVLVVNHIETVKVREVRE